MFFISFTQVFLLKTNGYKTRNKFKDLQLDSHTVTRELLVETLFFAFII